MLDGLTYELKIGRKFIISEIDDAGNFANASEIHICVLCEGEKESSVPLELEIYKISLKNGAIFVDRVFKADLVDRENLRHSGIKGNTNFQMSKSKVVLLCDLRQRWLFVGNPTKKNHDSKKNNFFFQKV